MFRSEQIISVQRKKEMFKNKNGMNTPTLVQMS